MEADDQVRLEVRLLGGFRVELADEAVRGFESQKVRALLAYLACHPDRDLTREHLADLLWPDSPPDAARRNLRQALYNLRQGLGPRGSEVVDGGGGHNLVRLSLGPADRLDVAEFEAAFHRGLPGADEVVAGELMRAVELYEGDFLEGFLVSASPLFENWLVAEQERLREAAVQALRALVDHFSARGEYNAALRYCRRLVAVDPLSEEAHRELMRLLVLAGRRREALSHYEDLVALLARELGVEPVPETQALHRSILDEDLAADPARPKPRPSLPLGPFVPLVGRGVELEELRASWRRARGRLGSPAPRLALVQGEPGIGKSRLLRTFLNQVSSPQPLRTAAVVVQGRCPEPAPWNGGGPFGSLLDGLQPYRAGLPASTGAVAAEREELPTPETVVAAVQDVLRAIGGPLALYVDNLHLASPAAADLLEALLAACAGEPLWIVATCEPADLGSGHPLERLAERPDVDAVHLHRLEDDGVREICRALLGERADVEPLARYLFRASEGLPLAVVEAINSLCDLGVLMPASRRRWSLKETPPPVAATGAELERLIVRRVDRLPSSARRLATLAAVVGVTFDVELLQRCAREHIGVVEIAIELMLERWLLRQHARRWSGDPRERDLVLWAQGARRGRFEFAHPLIQRALYRSLPDARRRELHRQVADILAERHEPSPERVAFHYLEGSAGGAALPWLAAAAERALAMRDLPSATELLSRANTLLRRPAVGVERELAKRWEALRRRVESAQPGLALSSR
jgi:DNA-binding SARP family transcriptional activator